MFIFFLYVIPLIRIRIHQFIILLTELSSQSNPPPAFNYFIEQENGEMRPGNHPPDANGFSRNTPSEAPRLANLNLVLRRTIEQHVFKQQLAVQQLNARQAGAHQAANPHVPNQNARNQQYDRLALTLAPPTNE